MSLFLALTDDAEKAAQAAVLRRERWLAVPAFLRQSPPARLVEQRLYQQEQAALAALAQAERAFRLASSEVHA